jgi:hypothetical protein
MEHADTIGPHHAVGDKLQYYTYWPETKKHSVLELPEIDFNERVMAHRTTWATDRRETEIDDHGERYPPTWQGPGVYVYLHIPSGIYTLSLYLFNPNGHTGAARDRDFALSLPAPTQSYQFVADGKLNLTPLAEVRGSAHGRVADSCGGVWKRFLVRGPMRMAVHVSKNYSFNTLVQAAILDPLAEHPAPYFYGHRAWRIHQRQRAESRAKLVAECRTGQNVGPVAGRRLGTVDVPEQILQLADALEHCDPAAWAANQRLAYAAVLRCCVAQYGPIPDNPQAAAIAEKCYYHLSLFHRWEAVERSRGLLTSRQIEKGLRLGNAAASSYAGLAFGLIRWRVAQMQHPHRAMDTAQRLESLQWLLDQGGVAGGTNDR